MKHYAFQEDDTIVNGSGNVLLILPKGMHLGLFTEEKETLSM